MDNPNATDEAYKLAYSVIEAARAAGVGRSTIFEALASGDLKAVKLGRRTLIEASELRRFIAALPPARRAGKTAA